jgi:sialate O-acetylesterase
MKKIIIFCFFIIEISQVFAQSQHLQVASIFTDSMVLQQGVQNKIWGKADADKVITISLLNKKVLTKSDAFGSWTAILPKLKLAKPFEICITSNKETLCIKDVLVGEVWLASGQSNMQFNLASNTNSTFEIKNANYPNIRYFDVEKNVSRIPLNAVKGSWKVCTPENAKKFSAVAYFFAKALHLDKNVPVGIIGASWGATPVEAWTSGESLANNADFKDSIAHYKSIQDDWQMKYQNFLTKKNTQVNEGLLVPPLIPEKNYATALYNAMIAPIIPFAIKGVIWYQGENNAKNAYQYRTTFPLLINDWRTKWNKSDLPFIYVQLPNFRAKNTQPVFKDDWTSLREAQTMTLSLPNTAMAVTIDLGDEKQIHPTTKNEVGRRLFLAADHLVYGGTGVYTGPQYSAMNIKNDKVELSFKNIGNGLVCKGDQLLGFEVSGADKKFYWATAKIEGNKVVVYSKDIVNPVAVRYAWSSNPTCNLYNSADLPARPFRTDNWE